MKTARQYIIEREAAQKPENNKTRTYLYVRPISNGEACIEVWAARNRRRDNRLLTKSVYRFYTNSERYQVRDMVKMWFSMGQKLFVDFSESGYGRSYYSELNREDLKGKWDTDILNLRRSVDQGQHIVVVVHFAHPHFRMRATLHQTVRPHAFSGNRRHFRIGIRRTGENLLRRQRTFAHKAARQQNQRRNQKKAAHRPSTLRQRAGFVRIRPTGLCLGRKTERNGSRHERRRTKISNRVFHDFMMLKC